MARRLATTNIKQGRSDWLSNVYSENVKRTRAALQARLASSPAGADLAPYFDRGKMLRARLVFAAADAVGAIPDDVQAGAEAIELLHGASLLHDDIIDRAAQRRGLVSVHEKLGVEQTLVLGDDLLLMAFSALAGSVDRHPADRLLKATDTLTRLARDCCRGQYDELCAARWITEKEYLAIVRGKTAAQFVAAASVGAILGDATISDLDRIRTYAQHVGIAFQISDDLLDLYGNPATMGKPIGNSLALGRPLLPLIYLWETDPESAQDAIRQLGESSWSIDDLLRLFDRLGILDRVQAVQTYHVAAATDALSEFKDLPGVDALRQLASRASAEVSPSAPGEPEMETTGAGPELRL